MKKNLLAFLCLVMALYSCGEAGIQSDISQIVQIDEKISYTMEVPLLAVGQNFEKTNPETVTMNENIDGITADEFEDYLDEIQKITIGKIWCDISDFSDPNQADLNIEVKLIVNNGNAQTLMTRKITAIQQYNTDDANEDAVKDFLLYDEDAPGDTNAAVMAELENAIRNSQSFRFELVIYGEDVVLNEESVSLEFGFWFDITARVQLD